jgi:glycosyltransferase involved in cell wall biosynthesis
MTMRIVPNEPTLSVVMPVRNVEAFLPDMFAALERNAEPDFQFIVVDDGSDDGTPDVIAAFAQRLPLHVVRHETAVGLASARNAGLDVAGGRYVTFLDGDDWISRDYLRRLVEAIDGLGCDMVRDDHVQVRGRARVAHRAPEARRGVVLDPRSGILPAHRRTMVDYPYAWAGIYRRDLGRLLFFPDGLHTAEDRPWIWRLHREARSYAVVTLAGVFYRRLVASSLTQIGDARQLHFLDAFAMVLDQVAGEPDLQAKAIRQFLAVLAHQIATGSRFTVAARRRLRGRARRILAALPREALHTALPPDNRREILRPLLPAGVRRLEDVA